MPRQIPLTVLATVDPVLRDIAIFGLVTDAPGVVALRHDIRDDDGSEGGSLRRVVVDASGVIEDLELPLEHACLSCAVREDALPTRAPDSRRIDGLQELSTHDLMRARHDTAIAERLVDRVELAVGLSHWLGRDDVLEPWLGARSAAW